MRAGDAGPYFETLAADLQQTQDPELSAWYATEISLTEEHRDAEKLQNLLHTFGSRLSTLIDTTSVQEAEQLSREETEFVEANELINEDEWLTPEERKRKSVETWLDDVLENYQGDVSKAREQTKASKKEKALSLAKRRFVRNFEHFDQENGHIAHDPESLEYALDSLRAKRPRLAEAVVENTVAYMHENNKLRKVHDEHFVDDSSAFAGVIERTTGSYSDETRQDFQRILQAMYEKQNFRMYPQAAGNMHVALARAMLKWDGPNPDAFYQKVVDIAYLRDETVQDPPGYLTGVDLMLLELRGSNAVNSEINYMTFVQARLAFAQARFAFAPHGRNYYQEMHGKYFSDTLYQQIAANYYGSPSRATQHISDIAQSLDPDVEDYTMNTQHYDAIETYSLDDGLSVASSSDDKRVPSRYTEAETNSKLRQARLAKLAPRALAHDIIHETIRNEVGEGLDVQVHDIPISPGMTVSYFAIQMQGVDEEQVVNTPFHGDLVLQAIMQQPEERLHYSRIEPNADRVSGFGILRTKVTQPDGHDVFVFAILRSSVPSDYPLQDPHLALITSMARDIPLGYDLEKTAVIERISSKIDHIKQNRHNYLGRRPLKFALPEQHQSRGLRSIQMRQHPDRKNIVVEAYHDEGKIELMYDDNLAFKSHTLADLNNPSVIHLAFQELVVDLFAQWACRPVVETSEGSVSHEDAKSKVNLGFLRYLPAGFRFSERQRQVFRKEQHGDLATESLRRQAQDPTGLGRSSTYVRENFDPTKPPLEVYYDVSALGQSASNIAT
jgi:hypothetical protein